MTDPSTGKVKVKVTGDPNFDGVSMSYKLYDEDDTIPVEPSLGSWASVFHAAYIDIDYLYQTPDFRIVPFDRNLSAGGLFSGVAWGDVSNLI